MRTAHLAVVLLLGPALAGLPSPGNAACGGGQDPAPAAGRPAPQTGGLTEEQFKALHVLKKGELPPRRGRSVEIAGTGAYLSLPPGAAAPMPGVIVIHEWWGLNDNIMHWADRLAAEGYAALAVDLYGGKVADNSDDALSYMKAAKDERSSEILVAAERFLREDPRVLAPRTGSVGWCFGGSMSLLCARSCPELDAAAIYYGGRLTTDPKQLESVKAAVLGIFGTQDKSIPPETVQAFDLALTQAGVRHAIHTWEAGHAFANPSNARYAEKPAAEAWEKVRAFFDANLKHAPGKAEPAGAKSGGG